MTPKRPRLLGDRIHLFVWKQRNLSPSLEFSRADWAVTMISVITSGCYGELFRIAMVAAECDQNGMFVTIEQIEAEKIVDD
eukprot:3758039-Rhodomonas_salina.1